MGKSLFISRMAAQLRELKGEEKVILTIPIHGPHVTTDSVMKCLEPHQDNSHSTIIHFDIAPSVCVFLGYRIILLILLLDIST